MINKLKTYIVCMLLIASSPLFSQTENIDFKSLKEKYKNEDAAYLRDNKTYIIEPDGDNISIKSNIEYALVLLNDKAAGYAQREISYVKLFSSISDIDAYTLVPKEKGGYKKVKVKEFADNNNTSEDVFYDDVSTKTFVFPQPAQGAITVLKYTETTKDPHFLNKFYFASGNPVEQAVFTIKVHKDVDLKFVLKNPKDDILFSEATEGNYKIYTWTRNNIVKLESESSAKSIAYETPHVICYIASYKGKTKRHSVLEDTKGLYNYCYSLLDKGLEKPDAEIMRITDSLITNINNNEDKVKAVYNYIQENIKYIAFEDGLGGFIPRKPSMVCTRKFGDCKDISNLICCMLNYAGVPSYHTWVGTNTIPYRFSELPIMGVANHMITAVWLNNQWYFLDGTAKFLSYRYPSDFVQGKQAMIGINADSFVLVDIPIIKGEVNKTRDTLYAAISGDTIAGKGIKIIDGLTRCEISSSVYYTSGNKVNELWENFLEVGQNNCKIENIAILGLKGRDSILQFKYDYKVPKYITQIDNEKYVNLNLLKLWNSSDIEIEKRTREYMFDQTKTNDITTIFNIPKGYTVTKVPTNNAIDKGDFGFNFTYKQVGNTIVYNQKFWYNSLVLNKPDFKAWNDTIELLHKAYRQNIVLTEITKK